MTEAEFETLLDKMPINTPEEALEYLKVFDAYCIEADPYGRVLSAHWKPASVRKPAIFRKASEAKTVAKLNYWQMPYEEAKKKFPGLPFKTWELKHKET